MEKAAADELSNGQAHMGEGAGDALRALAKQEVPADITLCLDAEHLSQRMPPDSC